MTTRTHVFLTLVGTPYAVEDATRLIGTVLDVTEVTEPVAPHRGSRLVKVEITAHLSILDPRRTDL